MNSMLQIKALQTHVATSNTVVCKLLSVCHVFNKAQHAVCSLSEGDVGFAVCVVGFQCLILHAHKQLKLPWLGGS